VELYKDSFRQDYQSPSLAKSFDVAFGDWGTSLLTEEQILYASREVCATYVVVKNLYY
jgi:hypothetical protein